MNASKGYSKRSFWVIIGLGVLIAFGLSAGIYWGIDWYLTHFSKTVEEQAVSNNLSWILQQVEIIAQKFYPVVVPTVVSVILLAGLILWLILKFSVADIFERIEGGNMDEQRPAKGKKDFVDQKIEKDRKTRLFLHSLSVLQRDGRLLDFFDEDLSLYEDDQIGAAVRSVQEDCKKAIKKYIDPRPVIEKEEGDRVTIESGFDIDAVKLVGNVSGEPPFEGVLKHRGWKAGKKEIPKLSDIQDATIITPAEVEIQ